MIRLRRPGWRSVREFGLSLTALLGLACMAATLAALFLDIRPVVFRSGSMSPAIGTGALAFARTTPATDLKVGDVVTVRTGSGVNVTHRIIAISLQGPQATLALKGDANALPDERAYVVSSARKVLVDVPHAGYVVSWASSSAGVFIGGLVVGAALLLIVRPGRTRPPTPVAEPEESAEEDDRRRARASRLVGAGLVIASVGLTATLGKPTSTTAFYTDTAGLAGGTFTRQVSPPVITACTVGNGNSITANITWQYSVNPDRFEVRYNNGTPTQTFAGTLRSGTLTAPMNNISGQFWIVAIAADGTTSPDSGRFAYSGVGGKRECQAM